MTQDEAERWCRENRFDWMAYRYPAEGQKPAGWAEGQPLTYVPGEAGVWCAGWASTGDSEARVRVHVLAPTLGEAVEEAREECLRIWSGAPAAETKPVCQCLVAAPHGGWVVPLEDGDDA